MITFAANILSAMKIRTISLAMMMAMSLHLNAQTLAKNYKTVGNGNPISGSVFCADPTALDYNGRLYVYGTNDHQQFIKNGKKGGNGYGDIKSLVVFSTDDMVNWTFHGTIDVQKVCAKWGSAFFKSWAPSVTWRRTAEGKDEFFLYFANWAVNVGVLTADSPLGPWKSPLTKALVDSQTPGVDPCSWCFDPGVVIDENGTGWLSFGGGDPNAQGNDLQPNNAGIVKLKPSMTEVDGEAVKIPAPYHLEASELNVLNGKFVYTYCSSWVERKDNDWNAYKSAHNVTASKPGACTMCYMVSDSPMIPDSWVYKDVYGPHPGFPSPNNHSHLHKFQGEYYYIYHWGALLKSMLDAHAVEDGTDGFRSICVDKATVNEQTPTVNKVAMNIKGVSAIKKLNPYELQQAETTSTSGGVSYEDYRNVNTVYASISSLGNDASANLYVRMAENAWTQVSNVDFGNNGPKSFILRAKGKGTLHILKSKTSGALATIEFSSDDFEDQTFSVDPDKFKGAQDLLFVFSNAENVMFDAWQFSESEASGVSPIQHAPTAASHCFDLSGRRLGNGSSHHGIVIEQYQDANGNKHSRKHVQ